MAWLYYRWDNATTCIAAFGATALRILTFYIMLLQILVLGRDSARRTPQDGVNSSWWVSPGKPGGECRQNRRGPPCDAQAPAAINSAPATSGYVAGRVHFNHKTNHIVQYLRAGQSHLAHSDRQLTQQPTRHLNASAGWTYQQLDSILQI